MSAETKMARHVPIRQNGGKAYATTPDHETVKAPVAQDSRARFLSLFQLA